MSILDQLRSLSAAEDFFTLLEVPFDPARLSVVRLHILKRMGQYLAASELDGLDDAAARQLCRAHLEQAYADFVTSTPLEQRVFKVLKEAVAPKAPAAPTKAFVPLSSLIGRT